MTAVYRTLPAETPDNAVAVRYDDDDALTEAVGGAAIIIHAALNTRARGKAFIPANRAVTDRLLALADPQHCKLFVYFSSQVVYAALDPVRYAVQSEDLTLTSSPGLDAYTRLKLEEESKVIEACRAKGIAYLIVRPTVVMGPHMQWSSGIVQAMRMAPFGIGKRQINLIHVEDLSERLLALVDKGVANEIVNLGDLDVSSDDYFRHAANLARRRVLIVPDWLANTAGRAIPSTLWFLAHSVRVSSEKLQRLTGVQPTRQLADFFDGPGQILPVLDREVIGGEIRSGRPYHVIGKGYYLWFNDPPATDQLVMEPYAGIVGLGDDNLTIRAGTTLRTVLDYLAPRGLTLATLPEFVDISAGACFFAEVHGSSNAFISLYDLITAISYIDSSGEERHSVRDNALWDRLRGEPGIVVTEVTFKCRPAYRLANVIEWKRDTALDAYLAGDYRINFSTTLHWYPGSGELMVYNVNPVEADSPGDRRPFAPMRGSPAGVQKFLLSLNMRGKRRIVGQSEHVLAPWSAVPAKRIVGRFLRNTRWRVRNMEICVPDGFAEAFFARLREQLPTMQLARGQGVGVRFTRDEASGRGYVWVEMTSRNVARMHAMIEMARATCGNSFWLHRGKYVPEGIGVEHLFIPRQVSVSSSIAAVT